MKGASIQCPFCGEKGRERPFRSESLPVMVGAYLAHLIESHWELLENARRERLDTGIPVNDAWTRL